MLNQSENKLTIFPLGMHQDWNENCNINYFFMPRTYFDPLSA